LDLDLERNEERPNGVSDRLVSRGNSTPAVLVVEAREDLEVAGQVRTLLAGTD
jgi:acetate kinase